MSHIEPNRKRRYFSPAALVFLAVLVVMASGCAGPLEVAYTPGKAELPVKVYGPAAVEVEAFEDARPAEGISSRGSRTIGEVRTGVVVTNMSADTITLAEDVPSLVTRAFARELEDAGYEVVSVDPGFVVTGEVRELRLDIGSRDEVVIGLAAVIRDAGTGEVVWEGTERLEEERFAGVTGNTRGSISGYLSKSLATVIRTMLTEATPVVSARARGGDAARPAADVTEADVEAEAPVPAPPSAVPAGKGRLIVATDPPRSKVYLNGVYYGLTPAVLDVAPGIYDVEIRADGYGAAKEKVSVREGQTTEMEEALEKRD